MHVEYAKEANGPSYDNLSLTVEATKKTPNQYDIKQIVTRHIFKWTALVTAVTIPIITVVVPTLLEIPNKVISK